jgi:transposase
MSNPDSNASGFIMSDEQSAVKFSIELNDQHNKYFSNLFNYQRKISSYLYELIKAGEITRIKPFAVVYRDDTEVSDRSFKHIPEIKSLIEEYFGSKVLAANIDALNWMLVRQYGSYLGRNKKPMKAALVVRPKSFAPKSDMFQFDSENNQILMRKIEKDENEPHLVFSVKDCYYNNSELLNFSGKKNPHISKPQGGIISLKKNELVLLTREEVKYPLAEKTIGFDFNKSRANWITSSEVIPSLGSKMFPKSDDLYEIEQRIKMLQKKIRGKDKEDGKLNSRQRKGVRKKWSKAHAKQAALVEKYIYQILDEFKSVHGEFNLAIDTVTTGQQNGTFGNDKAILSAAKWCRKNEVAHIYVPTPNTSRRCSCCGVVSRTARKLDVYKCANCGHVEHADENAAKNIREFADAILENGFRMVGTLSRQYKINLMVFLNSHFSLKQ